MCLCEYDFVKPIYDYLSCDTEPGAIRGSVLRFQNAIGFTKHLVALNSRKNACIITDEDIYPLFPKRFTIEEKCGLEGVQADATDQVDALRRHDGIRPQQNRLIFDGRPRRARIAKLLMCFMW